TRDQGTMQSRVQEIRKISGWCSWNAQAWCLGPQLQRGDLGVGRESLQHLQQRAGHQPGLMTDQVLLADQGIANRHDPLRADRLQVRFPRARTLGLLARQQRTVASAAWSPTPQGEP